MLINKLLKIAIISMILFSISNIIKAGVFDGTQGEGTEISPYLIYNITDLREMADSMPNIYTNYRDLHFKLMADITTPVDFYISRFGASRTTYNHTFDGNGYKITLFNYSGLFNTIETGSVIKNLVVI